MDPKRWKQVDNLLQSMLGLPPQERDAFLCHACRDDKELESEVRSLLTSHQQAGRFLDGLAIDEAARALVDNHRDQTCEDSELRQQVEMLDSNHDTARLVARGSLVGREFGSYRILSLLGAGGMGEVYRAYDSKLGRDVAIKTLPYQFARDPERLARFRREARTLASLNHPNIAAIYGLEEWGEINLLVLELVEGETLHGPLPLGAALDRASQLAEALKAAHEHGIIHRDLKPANVKVTPQGRVKVLDFGLAKAISGTEDSPDSSPDPTVAGSVTIAGRIVGTPGYMSPEQARGEQVDQRTDIWGFGCLLYELLTGKCVLVGEPGSGAMAVFEGEPDWQALPRRTPAKIRDLLRHCLQKDVNRRLSHIGDAAKTIAEVQRGWNQWKTVAVAIAGLAALGVGATLWLRSPTGPPDHSDWVQLTKFPDPVSQPALSRDGRLLAFVRGPGAIVAPGQLYVKKLPDGQPLQLTHDNLLKSDPAFSPDGQRIAYTGVDTQFNFDTWVVSVTGEEPHLWLRYAFGLTWAGPRQLLFSERKVLPWGIVAAGEDRTSERDVYFPQNERGMVARSQMSPDGKWVLLAEFSAYGNWDQCRLVPADGSSPGRQVGPSGAPCSFVAWSPDGEWMYFTSKAGGLNHIWRQRFAGGPPQQFTFGITEEEGIAMAPDGRSLVTAVALESTTLWIHDARGERQISVLEGNAADPRFAPDGKSLYYRVVKAIQKCCEVRDPGELWVTDLASGHSQRIAPGFQPLEYDISRDGHSVAMIVSDTEGKLRVWLAPVNRSSAPRQLPNIEGQNPVFAADGEIFFRRLEGSSAFVYRIRPDGTGLRKALEQPVFYLDSISPDGRWVEIWGPVSGNGYWAAWLVPLNGGRAVFVGGTMLWWSGSGDSLWIFRGAVADGRTYIVPLARGVALPRIPEGGFHSEEEVATLPGARRLDTEGAPGPTLGLYAFARNTVQRNLYRIPIP
jgi:serine/threonine protein kinase/Tol biopolymer transport system component